MGWMRQVLIYYHSIKPGDDNKRTLWVNATWINNTVHFAKCHYHYLYMKLPICFIMKRQFIKVLSLSIRNILIFSGQFLVGGLLGNYVENQDFSYKSWSWTNIGLIYKSNNLKHESIYITCGSFNITPIPSIAISMKENSRRLWFLLATHFNDPLITRLTNNRGMIKLAYLQISITYEIKRVITMIAASIQ